MKKLRKIWRKFTRTRFCRTLKEYVGLDDMIAVFITIVGGLYYCIDTSSPFNQGWLVFYERVHIDLISIGITVLILGNANQFIQIRHEKRSLILQMGSSDRSFACEAVRQFRARCWLFDGTIVDANLRKANLSATNLRNARLDNTNLYKANLAKAHLDWASLRGACLIYAHLEKAILVYADLRGANLQKAHLNGADLKWTHLEGADLGNITHDDYTLWVEAKYNKTTQWPDGFDPVAAGCILVEDE